MKEQRTKQILICLAASLGCFWLGNRVGLLYVSAVGMVTQRLAAAVNLSKIVLHPLQLSSAPIPVGCGVGAILLVGLAYLCIKYSGHRLVPQKEYGSARWGTAADIAPFLHEKPSENIPLTATESLSLAMKMPVTAENNYNRNKNVIVFGPSGSGKSYSVAGPQLLQFNSNYVLSDPKGELLDTYGNVLVSQGYDVKVFNLKDRDKSDHYNPFAYIHDTDDIVVVAKNLIKNMKEEPRQKNTADPIWEEGSTSLLEALLAYVYFEQPPEMHNMNSVMELFVLMQHRYGPQGRSQLDDIFEDLAMEKPASFAARQYGLYHMAPDKTAQSIDVSLGMRMSAFNIPSIMKICEDDTIHLEELASDKKVALFVVTPDTTTAYNFLAAVMFQQCFQILVHTADNREDHCLPRHVRFLLDEFPNIGMIPDFQILISTIRSRNIGCTLIYQSIAQLKSQYGDDWGTILENCDSELVLGGGNNPESLEFFGKQLGKRTIEVLNTTENLGAQGSFSKNYQVASREMNQVVAEKALRGQNGLIREKYVTFSLHAENYQQAKEQLENRAADIADHFKRMGSSTRILSGIERLSLLQGIMRPNEEMSFSYDWLLAEDDLTTKDFISPSSYNWHPEHDDSRAVYRDRYQFGDKIGKTMYLRGIAPEMKNGLFSMLSELPFDHVITMHVDAMDQAEAVQEIEKKLAYMHKEEYDAIAKARERNMPASIAVSYDLKSKMHHTEQMMDDITTKNQKIFKVCILIHTYGDSSAQLDERVRRICSTVQQQTCRFDSILYEQRNAMNSMLPLGKKWLGLERTLETVSTAIYVPFTTQELFQPSGLYEGINARSKNLILCNRKLLPAPAGMVLGMTGYGKSFSVMQMVTNIMLRWPDDDIVLIDPEQEYTHLVTAMGGVVIDISASSPSHINPMDITEDYGDDEDPIRLKSQFLQNFCQLILHSSELSPQERTFIDVAAGLTYQRYMANPKREEMPTLHDFYRNLALQGEEVKPLLTALKLYVSGSMDLFAHQTNVNVQNHCICFNTVKLGKSMQSIGMLTVLDQVWNRITRNRVLGRRTWVFTDEFQQLLGNKDCTDFYFQLSSRARKWGEILTSITQHVRSVLDNEDARRMLSDCGYIKLLNQSPDDANDLARLLHISNEEKRYIENAEVGSGLLIVSKTVVPFNNDFPKDTELFRLMDTSPNRKP